MGDKLFRMKLCGTPKGRTPPPQIDIVPYYSLLYHEAIRCIYSKAFAEDPWPADWDAFDEFDPNQGSICRFTHSNRQTGGLRYQLQEKELRIYQRRCCNKYRSSRGLQENGLSSGGDIRGMKRKRYQ